jgi:hypothetical protein
MFLAARHVILDLKQIAVYMCFHQYAVNLKRMSGKFGRIGFSAVGSLFPDSLLEQSVLSKRVGQPVTNNEMIQYAYIEQG